MGAQSIPFVETAVDEISPIVKRLHDTYYSQKTRPLIYRIKALRKLYWAIEDHKEELLAALKSDLGKGYYASMVEEISWVQNDCIFMANNLEKWAKDEKPEDVGFPNNLMSPRLRKDPLGVVLVIG
jgi:beta-apo-4'-carotenal oxygenase